MNHNPKTRPLWSTLTCLFVLLIFVPDTPAGQITLAWDPPELNEDGSALTDLSGYIIYYGTESGSYIQGFDIGNSLTETIENLDEGRTYYFAVTAYDYNGHESMYSEEIALTVEGKPTSGPSVRSGRGFDDNDGIPDDGDGSGIPGDNPCKGGNTISCDDNCRTALNPLQEDKDSDGIGDACDNCRDIPNPDQNDLNANEDDDLSLAGIQHYGDICDPDFDNDGIVSLVDLADFKPYFRKVAPSAPVQFDLDRDGTVGLSDYAIWRRYYRGTPGPGVGN